MNYYQWNNLIGDYLFNKEKDDVVFLYITKEQLVEEIYKKTHFSDERDSQSIWSDFVDAVNNLSKDNETYPNIIFKSTDKSFGDRIRRLRDFFEEKEYPYTYPAYLAHLVLLIMGKANYTGDSDREIKKVIANFFKSEGIEFDEEEFKAGDNYFIKNICCKNTNAIRPVFDGGIWKELHEWSSKNGKGITYFNFEEKRYVGMITDQCLISANVRERIRELYSSVGLNKDGRYALEDFRLHLLSKSNYLDRLFNNKNATKLIKKDINLVRVLYSDFKNWDGTYESDSDGKKTLTKTYNLQMCCLVKPYEKTLEIEYRIKDDLPEDGIDAKYSDGEKVRIVEEVAGWSIPVKSSKVYVNGEGYHRTRIAFNPDDNDIYFMTRKQEFGNKIVFVSTDSLLDNGIKVFFISRKDFGENAKYFKDKELTNSEGYKLYEYVVNEGDDIVKEGGLFYRYYNNNYNDNNDNKKTLCYEGGLKIKGIGKQNEYLPRLFPYIIDYSLNNDLALSDNSTNREYPLNKANADSLYDYNLWIIPEDVPSGTYNLKGTNKSITILNPQDVLPGIDDVKHPCYGIDGKVKDKRYFEENNQPFFQDNHFYTGERNQINGALIEDQYPKSYMCQVDYAGLSRSTTDVTPNFGDVLIDWLYYQGECSRHDFVETYKFIQSQYKKETNRIIFPTTTASSALKWLQKAGFVDCYDGKVYPCSPRLVALPVEKNCCNKFHLVGCRSLNLLHSVVDVCEKHKNSFRFHAYQTTNGYLMSRLTPSSIFVECAGSSLNCFGCDLIVSYLCNDAVKILPPKPSCLNSIVTFSVGIEDMIRWEEINTLAFKPRAKFCIYELDSLVVNKNQHYTIHELLDVLNGVSLVQLFHNDYKYDNIIIDKDNNRFFRVPNEYESLGKMYVIKLNNQEFFNKNCVRWCINKQTGEAGLAVSKRIGLPRNLSLLMNYVSLFPPESLLLPELDKNHHYYYYIIKNGIRAEEIRAIIGKVLGLDLKQHTLEVAIDTVDMINQKLTTFNQPSKQKRSNDNVIDNSALMLSNFFVSGDIPALYVHQERAVIDALSRWPIRVLFSDEVGLGKTFEVASTMFFLKKYCGVKRVIILTPKSVLKQWQDELREHFKLNVWRFDSGNNSYVDSYGVTKLVGSPNPIGIGSPDIILMSAQYARGNGQNGSIFDREGACLPDLLILDEAHSARECGDVSGSTRKTQVYSMLEKVSRKIPHIILSTATPMQKDSEEYHSLLKLLGLSNVWRNNLVYEKSLDLIGYSDSQASLNDLFAAAKMLMDVMEVMKPSIDRLNEEQNHVLAKLICLKDKDTTIIADYVRDNWQIIRQLLILLHPAHLLTIRNTRQSLSEIGYKFPQRKLETISIPDSNEIEEFYLKVNKYLSTNCFSIENVLFPERNVPIGFVRVGYQQRVASSLYACKKSLERRLEKIKEIKRSIDKNIIMENPIGFDDQELDELLAEGYDDNFDVNLSMVNKDALQRAIGIESTSITQLLKGVNIILNNHKDLKIMESIGQAKRSLEKGDKVLVFSRYTDTVDALMTEFDFQGLNKDYKYGLYTGAKSSIVFDGNEQPCNKENLKKALFSGDIRIVFCSDAASEGLNLQAARVLINVDVPWTPSRLEQRIGRIERLGQLADEVVIYNVWYPNSIEARMYQMIQQRFENRNLALGEFSDIVAKKIRMAILNDEDNEDVGENELIEIRNSKQVAALEELWSQTGNDTESELTRKRLMEICAKYFNEVDTEQEGIVKVFEMQDGTRCNLTSKCGMEESISLKSEIWDFFKYNNDSLQVVRNTNGRPAYFEIDKYGKKCKLKHSSVPKVLLKEKIGKEDVLIGRPPMLPNSRNLDLSYTVDCEIEPAPSYDDEMFLKKK